MRRLLAVLILLASGLSAQEATLITPVVRPSEAKFVIDSLRIEQAEAYIVVKVRDAASADIRDVTYRTENVVGLLTAIDTVRATETGGVLRRANFRILGFLADNGFLTGVTLVP